MLQKVQESAQGYLGGQTTTNGVAYSNGNASGESVVTKTTTTVTTVQNGGSIRYTDATAM